MKVLLNKASTKLKNRYKNSKLMKRDQKLGSFNSVGVDLAINLGLYIRLIEDKQLDENKEDKLIDLMNHRYLIFSKQFNVNIANQEGLDFKQRVEKILSRLNKSNIKEANNKLTHVSSDYQFIDWQQDFFSKYSWNAHDWSKNIIYGNVEGADIKTPWELGRLHQITDLALLYFNSQNETVLDEYCNQVYDFVGQNPPRFGTQWMTTMDIGIRLVNLLFSYDLIKSKCSFNNEFEKMYNETIVDHYEFLSNNLEWSSGQRANHYFANIICLIISSIYINSKEADEKLVFSFKELINELNYQFNSDGGNFEASLPYHYYLVEMILTMFKLVLSASDYKKEIVNQSLNGDIIIGENSLWFKKEISERINSIIRFSENNLNANCIPSIGDEDSGRMLDLSLYNYSKLDLLSEVVMTKINLSFIKDSSIIQDQYFLSKDFGVFRKSHQGFDISLRCGDVGQKGKGGHSHNDQLSFVLSLNKIPIIVDPGTYNYTGLPQERNKYRSVKMHNTFSEIEDEQNLWDLGQKDDLFWIKEDRTKAHILTANNEHFIGVHYSGNKEHKRIVRFTEKIEFIDTIQNGIFEMFIHFHPDVQVQKLKDYCIIQLGEVKMRIQLPGEFSIENYDYSPYYRYKQKSSRLHISNIHNSLEWSIESISR